MDFESRLRKIERLRSGHRPGNGPTKVDADGQFYVATKKRRRRVPLTGFLFTMAVMWCGKALMLVQNAFVPAKITLDIEQPLHSFWSLMTFPDPVTVWLADLINMMSA